MNCIGFLISYVHMLRVLNKLDYLAHPVLVVVGSGTGIFGHTNLFLTNGN